MEETYWTIRDERRKALDAVSATFNEKEKAFQDACDHPQWNWLQDWHGHEKRWHKCCSRCFKALATTFTKPDGAIG